MIKFEGEQMKAEFETAFGFPMTDLTASQLWWMTKFGKHLRGRCRSNAALNNYMNRNFTQARFIEIPKVDPHSQQEYKGLEIKMKVQ